MLDPVAYRTGETAAKRAIASWRLSNVNDPYVFLNQGFPVRTESVLDLAQILDTMQEERFEYYMAEIGGFTDEDAKQFVDVCVDYIAFYLKTFQRERVVVPFSTLMAHFVIYRKLIGYNPGFRRLLELGPGCGYLSFFLRGHDELEDYSQIESTESFYLLQSHINSHVFGNRFIDHALPRVGFDGSGAYIPKVKWHNPFHYEQQKVILVGTNAACNHYPWWRMADAATKRFDMVTSNANLNEFSREALFQYLSLIRDVLSDDGVIIAQCLGGGSPSYESVFANMKQVGFVPVALVSGTDVPGRLFVVSNGVFVGEKHPLYAKYADVTPKFPLIDRSLRFVNQMYFINEDRRSDKRMRSTTEIIDMIYQRIGTLPAYEIAGGEIDPDSTLAADAAARQAIGTQVPGPAPIVNDRGERERLRLIAEIDQLRRELTRQVTDLSSRRESERARLSSELDRARCELSELRHSTSWRVTAPLRSAFNTLMRRGVNGTSHT